MRDLDKETATMRTTTTTLAVAAAIGLCLALLFSAAASAAKPPIGRTYFVVSIGVATDVAEAYQLDFGCVEFTRTEICDSDTCGTWSFIDSGEKGRRQDSIEFQFTFVDDETGSEVVVEGRADLDSRGPKSSMGASATGIEPSTRREFNFALAGRAVGAARCQQLAEDALDAE